MRAENELAQRLTVTPVTAYNSATKDAEKETGVCGAVGCGGGEWRGGGGGGKERRRTHRE